MRTIRTSAGDSIEIGVSGRFEGQGRTVRAAIGDADLQPDEARRVAVVLIEQAADAEHRGSGRR